MIPQQIKALERTWHHEYTIREEKLLSDNGYNDLYKIVAALYEAVKPKISPGPAQKSFDEIFAAGSQNLDRLEKGDLHYAELVRSSGILNEHNAEFESAAPLTMAVKNILSEFSGVHRSYDGTLTIYGTLERSMTSELGKAAALDPDFQTYECWQVINKSIPGGPVFYQGWMDNLPAATIIAETPKILARAGEDKPISDIAYIDGDRGNNTEAGEAYLKMLAEHKDLEPFAYIDMATRGQGLLYFKNETALDESLMRKAGLENWLKYLDRLRHPNLQEHFLYSITEPKDFTLLIGMVLQANDWITPRVNLILLILQRFYDLFDKSLIELKGYATGHIPSEQSQKQQIAEQADQMYQDWLEHFLPESFAKIFGMIVTENARRDGLLHALLLWTCSHNKLYVREEMEGRKNLIDTIQETFIKSLNALGTDAVQLTQKIRDNELNWMLFELLHGIYMESMSGPALRDEIFSLYLRFIKSPEFFYSSGGEANLDGVINNSYYFSCILAAFDDPYEEWLKIYQRMGIHYEGWLENRFVPVRIQERFF